MAKCLLCNEEFDGSEPICPKCTSEHLAASVYKDPEEEALDRAQELEAQAAPKPAPQGPRTPQGVALSPSLEMESVHYRAKGAAGRPAGVVNPQPAKKPVSGPQGPAKRATATPARSPAKTPPVGKPAPAAPENELAPGSVLLSQYKVERKLGEGGFGAVYLADQIGLDRKAVIKVVQPGLAKNPTFVQRFHREAKVLAALDHHHLVKVFNFGQLPSGLLFLAMEYGGDRTLGQELHEFNTVELRRALQIISQVLDALAEAHDRGIVHRDLKPANILIGKKGGEEWVKVVDVGIAKVMDSGEEEDERLTGTGMVVGTPSYYSPEQARGLDVDGRSDLYAAGIVLYEMLTGNLPIKGKTPIDFVRAHAVDEPTPAKHYGVILPGDVDKLIMRSLLKDPAKRFQSAREMKAAVDAARAVLTAQGVPKLQTPRKALQKKLMIGAGAAAGLIAVLLVLVFTTSGPEQPVRKKKAAPAAPATEVALSPKLSEAGAVPPVPPAEAPPAKAPAAEAPPALPPADTAAAAAAAPPAEGTAPAADAQPAADLPPPAAVAEKGRLIIRGLGNDISVAGAVNDNGGAEVPVGGGGNFSVQSATDGWNISVKYRKSGGSLSLTVESKPLAVVYSDDAPLGRVGTVKVGKSAPTKIVFKQPAGGELVLIAKYAP